MPANTPLEVKLTSLSADGCAYTDDGQYAVFGAIDGETVQAHPVARKRKKKYLRTETVLQNSADRVEPICGVASMCGGCSFQHVSMQRQLDLKQSLLKQHLEPLAPKTWLTPLSGAQSGYRSKARLGVKYVEKKERVLIGFREKMKPYITDTDDCPILINQVRALLGPLNRLVSHLSVVRAIPQIEVAGGDDCLAIVIRHMEPLSSLDLEKVEQFAQQYAVLMYLQPGGLDSTHLVGQGTSELSYDLPDHELTFYYGPHDFTQVNLETNRLMVELALGLLDLNERDIVLDAFCGIGNFSLPIARSAGRVLGAEAASASIQRATRNAERNGVNNALFHEVDLFSETAVIPDFTGFSTGFNKVLLDPPRSGAEALSKRLASSDIERVVYVSCNPETLARDAKTLVDGAFELESAGVINMFPHTTHIESIALFQRAG